MHEKIIIFYQTAVAEKCNDFPFFEIHMNHVNRILEVDHNTIKTDSLDPKIILKKNPTKNCISFSEDCNSVDPDEMLHDAAFHLGLHCLPTYPPI